jgi:hypothetical protein
MNFHLRYLLWSLQTNQKTSINSPEGFVMKLANKSKDKYQFTWGICYEAWLELRATAGTTRWGSGWRPTAVRCEQQERREVRRLKNWVPICFCSCLNYNKDSKIANFGTGPKLLKLDFNFIFYEKNSG